MLELRPYQQTAVASVFKDWGLAESIASAYQSAPANLIESSSTPLDRVLVMSATGTGKTVVLLSVIEEALRQDPEARVLLIAHRKELIDQPIKRAKEFTPHLAPKMGVVMGSRNDVAAQIIVATIQTLERSECKRLNDILAHGAIKYFIIDECFPAGTLVDGRPIESIRCGDIVTAWDEENGEFAKGKVVRLFRKPAPAKMYKISTTSGNFICTGNHPILTTSGWKKAEEIKKHDGIKTQPDLLYLQEGVHPDKETMGSCQSQRSPLLLEGVRSEVQGGSFQPDDGGNKPEVRQRQDEGQQPSDTPGCPSEELGYSQREAICRSSGGQRKTASSFASCPGGFIGAGMGDRVSSENRIADGGLSIMLQDRYSQPGNDDRSRGGRTFAPFANTPEPRREETDAAGIAWVENITVYEQGSDREFDSVCPDGFVYNIEVEKYHTYTANGHVVHNCHHTRAATYEKVLTALGPVKMLGLTATPKRTDRLALGIIYQKLTFRFSIEAAIREGALCEMTPLGFSLPDLRTEAGGIELLDDADEDAENAGEEARTKLGDLLSADNILEIVYSKWAELAKDRKTIIFCASVSHAHAMAAFYRTHGIKAEAIDGTTPMAEREAILARFASGETQVLCNMMILTEGFDDPATSCIVLVSPTRSDLIVIQRIGRGLRPYPGKKDCLVLDFSPKDSVDFMTVGDLLDGVPLDKKDKKKVEKAEKLGMLFSFRVSREGIGDVDPGEIQMRVLDYMKKNSLAWISDGIYSAAALDENNVLVLSVPDGDKIAGAESEMRMTGSRRTLDYLRKYRLYKVTRTAGVAGGKPGPWIVSDAGEFEHIDAAQSAGDTLGQGYENSILGGKDKGWRKLDATPAQIGFLEKLGGIKDDDKKIKLKRGMAAQRITYLLAKPRVVAYESARQKAALGETPSTMPLDAPRKVAEVPSPRVLITPPPQPTPAPETPPAAAPDSDFLWLFGNDAGF